MTISWSDVILVVAFWVLVLFVLHPKASRDKDWRDRPTLGGRVLALCIAVSLSFQIDPLGAWFDSAVGVNNLSWLLGYLNAVVGIYAGVTGLLAVRDRKPPRWATLATVGAILTLFLLFPGFAAGPEELHNGLPSTVLSLLFRAALYVHATLLALFTIGIMRRWLEKEELPTGRLRFSSGIIACATGVLFFIMRGPTAFLTFLMPVPGWLNPSVIAISSGLIVVCLSGLFLTFSPVAWLRLPARWLVYIEQMLTLRDVERFRNQLVAVSGPIPWTQPSWLDRWLNTPYALYCTLIDILDRRILLQASLENADSTVTSAHRELAGLLETIPDTTDWVEVLKHVHNLSRQAARIPLNRDVE
jgi:hypothetical protein